MLTQIGQQMTYETNTRAAVGCVDNMGIRINSVVNVQSSILF